MKYSTIVLLLVGTITTTQAASIDKLSYSTPQKVHLNKVAAATPSKAVAQKPLQTAEVKKDDKKENQIK